MCTGFFTDAQDDFFYGMPSSGAFSLINGAEGCFACGKGKKKGATPCSNLVNLKSNTMKNTVQRYGFWANLQIKRVENYVI